MLKRTISPLEISLEEAGVVGNSITSGPGQVVFEYYVL